LESRTNGDKLVDANMRELLATGFMSNRGRQNVASYLIFDLGVDWRHGAAHFEELLLDYDPCSNWGNWVAAAGLTGQRVNKFNTKKQLNDYDPNHEYVNHWLSGSDNPRKVTVDDTVRRKLDMSLDDAVSLDREAAARNGGKGKGKSGKGGRNNSAWSGDNDKAKRRRWQNRGFGQEWDY